MPGRRYGYIGICKCLGVILLLALTLSACSSQRPAMLTENKQVGTLPLKVGILFSIGGLGDRSFNDATYSGLTRAEQQLGIKYHYIEPSSSVAIENATGVNHLRQLAQENDLVIANSFALKEACEQVAKEYPKTRFVIMDAVIDAPNVTSIVFNVQEGAFLAGAAAGWATKTQKIAFIGGLDNPVIGSFKSGYEQGAAFTNKKIQVVSGVIGGDRPFSNPSRGYEIAKKMASQGVDVVFAAAGGSGIGVIEACREQGIYAIGVDSDQDYLAEGTVLTSVLKRVDLAVFRAIEKAQAGELKAGIMKFGITEGGIDVTDFKYTKNKLPADFINKINELKKQLNDGVISMKSE